MLNIEQKLNSTPKSFLKFIKNIKTKKLHVTMLSNPINSTKHQCLWTLVDTLASTCFPQKIKIFKLRFSLDLFLIINFHQLKLFWFFWNSKMFTELTMLNF